MLQPICLDTYDFPTMRREGTIYVDKTSPLHTLIRRPGARLFFVSRPRRFGKSLMISTLDAIFRGRRELFEGLAIAKEGYGFEPYPVLRFSFGTMDVLTVETFEKEFKARVADSLREEGIAYDPAQAPGTNFGRAIDALYERGGGRGVVVLIDEYDAPVSRALADLGKAETIREILSAFYGQLKEKVGKIRFMMMTGVTKFTQLSVFSALNNLVDLTLSAETATMLGYTEEDLTRYFEGHMRAHAEVMGVTYEAYREEFERWYDGYRFSPDEEKRVYNPYAVARVLGEKRKWFTGTWTQTGQPSALRNFFRNHQIPELDYECLTGQDETLFDTYDLRDLSPVTLLYQGGYLTIKDYDPDLAYTLGVPNEEVRQSLNAFIARQVARQEDDANFPNRVRILLNSGDFAAAFEAIAAIYAHLPYGAKEGRVPEASYQRSLFILLTGAGLRVVAEDTQSAGRADIVARSTNRVYVFELKVGGTAREAIAQIRARGYAEPYRAGAEAVFLFGLAFDHATHRLADTAAEPL